MCIRDRFNERIIANTQLQPTHTLDLTQLNAGLGDVTGYFRVQPSLDLEQVKSWNLNYSLELLLGEYFAGADTHQTMLNLLVLPMDQVEVINLMVI